MDNLIGVCSVVAVVVMLSWRLLNWVWLRPKRLEKCLRDQGLSGSSYKLLFGDIKEMVKMFSEAMSKTINLSDDIVPKVMPFAHKTITTYGKNSFAWKGTKPVVHIMEPTLIKEILSKIDAYQKPRGGNPLSKLLFGGLLVAEDEQWTKRRKIINPAFHLEKLKCMQPAFSLSCSEMISKWEELLTVGSSCEIDVWPDIQTLSGNVISRTAFGSSFEEGRNIFEVQKEQAELIVEASQSFYVPGSRFLPTKRNKRIKAIHKEVHGSIRSIIDGRLRVMKAGEPSHDDLLGVLLDSNHKEIQQHGNGKSALSIDEVIEECKLFYFAGQETTANLLVWTMILLGQHTSWQERARDEVLKVFGKRKPDVDGLNRLKIVSMIVHEVLRLYPPAVLMQRITKEETKLGKLILPAGVQIDLQLMLMHHDKDLWGDDVKEFKPQRFFDGVSKATNGQLSFYPFSYGPRVCVGQNFAMIEAKMALSTILQHFSFTLSPTYTHAPRSIITLQPQFGAHLILNRL